MLPSSTFLFLILCAKPLPAINTAFMHLRESLLQIVSLIISTEHILTCCLARRSSLLPFLSFCSNIVSFRDIPTGRIHLLYKGQPHIHTRAHKLCDNRSFGPLCHHYCLQNYTITYFSSSPISPDLFISSCGSSSSNSHGAFPIFYSLHKLIHITGNYHSYYYYMCYLLFPYYLFEPSKIFFAQK